MTSDANCCIWPTPATIADFSYSKLSHFELFRGLPFQSYNAGDPDPATCDLKVYQDYLVCCFIRLNVAPGSRILEVGGGDSRILKFFSKDYECWNADKCEGLGNGPIKFSSPHFRIVYDYVGSFNRELPDHYFDFVFSISALEHTPEDQAIRANVLKDINRLLKPNCPSLHCFDAFLRPAGQSWVNGLIHYLYANAPLQTRYVPLVDIEADPDTYAMSQQAYEANWQPVTKQSYGDYGRPFSLNLFWTAQRPGFVEPQTSRGPATGEVTLTRGNKYMTQSCEIANPQMQTIGLKTLRAMNPWPDIHELEGESSYVWSLDGGGRHLIVDLIRERQPKVFLEVGVFVGGSSLQWLENSPADMTLLAADIWGRAAEDFVFRMAREPAPWIVDMEPVRALETPLKKYGIYKVAMHNLRNFRDRVIPLRMPIAELYGYVKTFIEPDVIYIDAGKQRQDYILAHETFPNSILCGDDWEWQNAEGECAVQPFVYEVAEARNCDVIAERATWVLRPRKTG